MKRLLILLLLLPVVCEAQINPARDSLVVMAYQQIGVPTSGTSALPLATMYRLVNRGISEVSSDFPAVASVDTVLLVPGAEGAALPSDFVYMADVHQIWGDSIRVPMFMLPDSISDALTGEDGFKINTEYDTWNRVKYYRVYNGRIHTVPMWFNEDNDTLFLFVSYYAEGTRLASASDTTDISPEYRDELVTWVSAKAAAVRGDLAKAAYYEALYDKSRQLYGRQR